MEIDKSTQGTLEEQMFYRRKTLKELTEIRHDNPTDEVMHQNPPSHTNVFAIILCVYTL